MPGDVLAGSKEIGLNGIITSTKVLNQIKQTMLYHYADPNQALHGSPGIPVVVDLIIAKGHLTTNDM